MASELKVPGFMQDINIFVSSIGHLGVSESVELPKIAFSRESKNAGGFEQEVKVGTFEKMDCKLVIEEYSSNVMEAITDNDAASFVIKGSVSQGGKSVPAVATIRGDFDTDFGSWKAKEAVKQTIEIKVKFFELEINGVQLVQIDTKNMIAKINGTDVLADLRANIQ